MLPPEKLNKHAIANAFLRREYFVYYVFILTLLFFTVTLHDVSFFSVTNFMNVIRQTTPVTIMAIGLTFALAGGHIDLSIGAVVALAALVAALLLQMVPVPVAVIGALMVGVAVGLINGLLIEWLKVSSLLITLGTMGVITGVARQLTNLESVPIIEPSFNFVFGSGSFGPVSVLLLWTLGIAALGYLLLRKCRFGRHLLAVGGNEKGARAMGISTIKVRIMALVLASSAAALAGLLYAGRLHGARYTLGEADLLTVIAAVAIGGTSLFGGRASILGAVIGSWLMGLINNGLILSGFSTNEQMIARGVILVVAVAIGVKEQQK
ncbi:ABC transporter permease [Gilvimarinus algae]|uniref:Autoinducer 2 import system permease protein LsrD n=1 Tax=Gilvimarinus algae TaxID=3058037 RepID=A0ABT8TC22_9GAMM|nr:ABC transporter permease [Gilvimarinus sp. SDUM040014]MDO3381465.1 ABC transporter permease [Gilvimarinus sp. SDUM040014]